MNWKILAVIVIIVLFIAFGGIGLTKQGFNFTKTEISKAKTSLSNFVTKQTGASQ